MNLGSLGFGRKVGIDLGTTTSRVWVQGRGVVLKEPTVVAASADGKQVLAVGTQAKQMLGRAPSNMRASRPIHEGVIADYTTTQAMIRYLLQKAVGGGNALFKPELIVAVPAGATQVERHAVTDAGLAAGARSVWLVDNPLAAIVGAGLPIGEASGNMVVDIGGGVSESAVISLGGVVATKGVRLGGNALDASIMKHLRKRHGIIIGEEMAEQIKIEIGSAVLSESRTAKFMDIKGRDAVQGLPQEIKLTADEVHEAMSKPLEQILEMVKKVLEMLPPELASDIIDKGVVLTGGGARLRDLDLMLTQELKVPAITADEPELCVVRGVGKLIEHPERYIGVTR